MRVAARELTTVRQGTMLARYALMGPVAFAQVEFGPTGSRGTAAEEPCQQAHWGFVLRGRVRFEEGDETTEFAAGTAFYVPAGGSPHRFVAASTCTIAGFAPVVEPVDESAEAMAARGVEIVVSPRPQRAPPPMLHVAGGAPMNRADDGIEGESAVMGPWTFMRTTYGALSGFVSGAVRPAALGPGAGRRGRPLVGRRPGAAHAGRRVLLPAWPARPPVRGGGLGHARRLHPHLGAGGPGSSAGVPGRRARAPRPGVAA